MLPEGCGGKGSRYLITHAVGLWISSEILSKPFTDRFSGIPKNTNKRIAVANGVTSSVLDLLTGFPVSFGDLRAP